jgi:hypothetical protein
MRCYFKKKEKKGGAGGLRHTNGQYVYKKSIHKYTKVLRVENHQANVIWNYNKLLPCTWLVRLLKAKQKTNIGEEVAKSWHATSQYACKIGATAGHSGHTWQILVITAFRGEDRWIMGLKVSLGTQWESVPKKQKQTNKQKDVTTENITELSQN